MTDLQQNSYLHHNVYACALE